MTEEYRQRCEWDNCEAEIVQELYPFCSVEHKEKWADKHYGKAGDKKTHHTIEFMKQRLLEMAYEERQKRNYR